MQTTKERTAELLEPRRMMSVDTGSDSSSLLEDPSDTVMAAQEHTKILVQDTFDNSSTSSGNWTAPDGTSATLPVVNERMHVRSFANRLITKNTILPTKEAPTHISTDIIVSQPNTYCAIYSRGKDIQNSVSLVLFTRDGSLLVREFTDGVVKNLVCKSWALVPGRTYHVDITDDGSHMDFTITDKENPSRTITVSAETEVCGKDPHVFMYTGDPGVYADNLVISQKDVSQPIEEPIPELPPPIPEPEVMEPEVPEPEVTEKVYQEIFSDTFDDISTSSGNWTAPDGTSATLPVVNERMHVRSFANRLITKNTISPTKEAPTHISTDIIVSQPNTYCAIYSRGKDIQNSVSLVLFTRDGSLLVREFTDGVVKNLVCKSWALVPGRTYHVDITDDGSHMDFTITDKENPSRTITVSAETEVCGKDPHVFMYTGDPGVYADNLVIEQLLPANNSGTDASQTDEGQKLNYSIAPQTPDIRVARIDGMNVDIRVRSNLDISRIRMDGGGILGNVNLEHKGGTNGDMVSLTFSPGRSGGIYNIRLYDTQSNLLSTVPLKWNSRQNQLTVVNQDDMWTAEDYVAQIQAQEFNLQATGDLSEDIKREVQMEALYVQAQEMMDADLMNRSAIENLDLSYASVRTLRNSLLWEESGLALGRSEAEELFFERYPQYKAENIQQTINNEWNGSTSTRRGQVEDRLRGNIGDLLDRVYQGCNAYNADMQNFVFPAALNVLMGVRRGETQQPLLDDLERIQCCLHGHVTIQLFTNTAFKEPSGGDILNAAKRVLFSCVDLVDHYAQEDERIGNISQREFERHQQAQWVAALEESQRLQYAYDPNNRVSTEVALANQQKWVSHMDVLRSDQQVAQAAEQDRSYERAKRLVAAAMEQVSDWQVDIALASSDETNVPLVQKQEDDSLVISITEQKIQDLDKALIAALAANPDDPDAATAEAQRLLLTEAETILVGAEVGGVDVMQMTEQVISVSQSQIALGDTVQIGWQFQEIYGDQVEQVSLYLVDSRASGAAQPIMILRDMSLRDASYTFDTSKYISEAGEYRIIGTARLKNGRLVGGQVGLEVGAATEQLSEDPVENAILNEIAENFPVDASYNWYNYLESGAHKAPHTLHAIDLNYGNIGEDKDAEIYAVDDGEVNRIYKAGDVTILVLRHQLSSGGTWDSVYMHMPMEERANEQGVWDLKDSKGNVIKSLKVGDTLHAGEHIAANGKEGTGGEHLHFEAHTGDWRSSPTINLDGLLRSQGIVSKVDASGRSMYAVSFNTDLQQWVNETDHVVAYLAEGQPLSSIYLVAWEDGKAVEEMERVVWDSRKEFQCWYRWDITTNDWFRNEQGQRLEWNTDNFYCVDSV